MRYLLILVLTLIQFSCSLMAPTEYIDIPANNANIRYMGRWDFTDSYAPSFEWAGATITAAFSGTSISMYMDEQGGLYDIFIDDNFYKTITAWPGVKLHPLASNLSNTNHTITIARRDEAHWYSAVFKGFKLKKNETLLPLPNSNTRKIEFLGDSYTVGYGNESSVTSCDLDNWKQTTNVNVAWGPLIAKSLNADYIVIGWSGLGMVKNYGDTSTVSQSPFPAFYDYQSVSSNKKWNFSQWTPDLVVICLGTNDVGSNPIAKEDTYVKGYHKFIDRILNNYPQSKILCVATHAGNIIPNWVTRVVDEEQKLRSANTVFYAEFPQNLTYSGCDNHPTANDDKIIAQAVADTIKSITGWK